MRHWIFLLVWVGYCADLARGGSYSRVENTTLRMPPVTPSTAYWLDPVLPSALTNTVVTLAAPPRETGRLFVGELPGLIRVIPDLANPHVETFLDIRERTQTGEEDGLCSFVFHPGFATNGQFFVFYTWKQPDTTNVYDRLSRFHVDPQNPNRADAASEEPLISQYDRHPWHQSGDLHFGPDGYLYVTLGDEGGDYGYENAGLFDHNFFSAVMRIDPDARAGGLPPSPHPAVHPGTYLVPPDNPFLGRTNYVIGDDVLPIVLDRDHLRGEFYAVGFRNPWRFSFDPLLGTLYCNDVGDASREEVNIVVPGAHYGWVMKEGTKPWPFWVPARGLTDPVYEYEHTEGRAAVTASLFYRGATYPELDGTYLFGDFGGQFSQMRPLGNGLHAPPEQLTWWSGLVTAGLDPATGEILMGGLGGVVRLKRVEEPGDPLPDKLSATGVFADLTTLTPNPGVIPYDVNQLFWSDHAIKRRWFCVPNAADQIGFHADDPWESPAGTVWVKHFDFPTNTVTPPATRRLETRLLVRTEDGVYGATYRWNDAGTDADLVPAEGAETDLKIDDGAGGRTQHWRFPGRNECLACHTAVGGLALSFNTAQLNHDTDVNGGGLRRNLITVLQEAGYFYADPDIHPNLLPRLPALGDETWSRESRIKAFLAANCVQCHQPGGTTGATWDARLKTPLDEAGIVDGPAWHNIGSDGTKIVATGDLQHSSMYIRLSGLGPLHMPPLGTFEVNAQAVSLVAHWITNDLPARQTYGQWATNYFGPDNVSWAGGPDQDTDWDGIPNYLEYMLGTSPINNFDAWRPAIARNAQGVRLRYLRKPNRGFIVEMSDAPEGPDWDPVDDPTNRLFFPSGEEWVDVVLPEGADARFFRVRVVTP